MLDCERGFSRISIGPVPHRGSSMCVSFMDRSERAVGLEHKWESMSIRDKKHLPEVGLLFFCDNRHHLRSDSESRMLPMK